MTEVPCLKFDGKLEMCGVQITNCCQFRSHNSSGLRDISSVQPRHSAWLLTPVAFHMRTVPVEFNRGFAPCAVNGCTQRRSTCAHATFLAADALLTEPECAADKLLHAPIVQHANPILNAFGCSRGRHEAQGDALVAVLVVF
jgi:hypothetical protein